MKKKKDENNVKFEFLVKTPGGESPSVGLGAYEANCDELNRAFQLNPGQNEQFKITMEIEITNTRRTKNDYRDLLRHFLSQPPLRKTPLPDSTKEYREDQKKIDKKLEGLDKKISKVEIKLDNATEQFDKSFEEQLREKFASTPDSPFNRLPKEKQKEAFDFAVAYQQNNFNLSRTVKAFGFDNDKKSHVRDVLIKIGVYKKSPKSGKKHGHRQATRERNLTPQERQKMN